MPTKNPWLEIPLQDYEAHMALPQIAQAQMLGDLLAEMCATHHPRSIALIGCAGGNGLERLDPACFTRVVAVDINPQYVTATLDRFGERFPHLEVITGDAQTNAVSFEPVELIYAALVFEYVTPYTLMKRLKKLLVPGGLLATVIQLPSSSVAEISPSPYMASLERLGEIMHLTPPDKLLKYAVQAGLTQELTRQIDLPSGKSFVLQTFRNPKTSGPGENNR